MNVVGATLSDNTWLMRLESNGTNSGFYYDNDVNSSHVLKIGGTFLWVDSTGDLRISSSNPTTDTSGVVVGSQS